MRYANFHTGRICEKNRIPVCPFLFNMTNRMQSPKKYTNNHLFIKQMCKLIVLISILFVVKLKFLIPMDGIELVTFTICLYALILKWHDCLLIICVFNLLVLINYGFGSWWFAYWIIWPSFCFATKLAKKLFAKNFILFSLWVGICGFSIIGWYFISDFIFFGKAFAIANLSSALIVNLTEGFVNFTFAFFAFQPIMELMKKISISDLETHYYKKINFSKNNI